MGGKGTIGTLRDWPGNGTAGALRDGPGAISTVGSGALKEVVAKDEIPEAGQEIESAGHRDGWGEA